MQRLVACFLALVLITVAISCGEKGVPPGEDNPTPYLQIVSGDNQSGKVKTFLPDSMIVRVVTSVGEPVIRDTIRFTQITPKDSAVIYFEKWPTDDSGYAAIRYRVDSKVGVDTIMAVSDAVGDSGAVYFQVTVTPGLARNIVKVWPASGQVVSTVAGEALADSVTVQLTDLYDNPTGGEKVYFVTDNRCILGTDSSVHLPYELDSSYTIADTEGLAKAEWTLSVNPMPIYPSIQQLIAYFKRVSGDTTYSDTVIYAAQGSNPGPMEYYYDIRPIFAENCFQCHGPDADTGYRVDYYYLLTRDGNMTPGDTNCLVIANSNPSNLTHPFANVNAVEEDRIIRWVMVNNGAPGSSGLNSYNSHMKGIIDASCVTCHNGGADYLMTTHLEIRGGGTDMVPNAIPGADSSLVVQKMIQMHNWPSLDPDSLTAAILADSIITWIVSDYMREY